jgi:ABC-type branched-subunit amino acid transport system substrate-binding protein
MRKRMMPTTLVAVTAVLVVIASTATGALASRTASPRTCAFELRIGDVLPFTGDLAAYGGNMDRAVKQAIVLRTLR